MNAIVQPAQLTIAEVIRERVMASAVGTVRISDLGDVVDGTVVSLTNCVPGEQGLAAALDRLVLLATLLASLNTLLEDRVVIGWWTSDSGDKYVDVGILADDVLDPLAAGRVLAQKAVGQLVAGRYREWTVPQRTPILDD